MDNRKRWIAEEPTTPHTRRAIGKLTAAALGRLEELAPRDQSTQALYLSAPYPSSIDRALQPLCDGLRVLDDESRVALQETPLSPAQARGLALYAERMSYLAVRKLDAGLIFEGLIAAAFLDRRGGTELLLRLLGKLYQAAIEIGADPQDAFHRAARLAPASSAGLFESFGRRDPGGRML
jgi:hypothetical protein